MKPWLFVFLFFIAPVVAKADTPQEQVVPGDGYSASRYESLWKKSPFAVATEVAASAPESPDYMLVGIGEADGISYASLIDKKNQEHFLISSDKPARGLTLTSINRGQNGTDTTATIQKDGEPLTLKLTEGPSGAGPGVPGSLPPGVMPQQIPMPGTTTSPVSVRSLPLIRFHRPTIHLPPRPPPQQITPPANQ